MTVAGDQAVEDSDFHRRHRGQRRNQFLVFAGLGKAEQRASFSSPALCNARIVRCADAKSRLLSAGAARGGYRSIAAWISARRTGLTTSSRRRRTMSIDPASSSFSCGPRGPRAGRPRVPARRPGRHAPSAPNIRRAKTTPPFPAARRTTSRSPRRIMTSVRSGESVGRSDIASRWPWPFLPAISTSACSSITGDRRSSGPAIEFVFARELPDQRAWRVGEDRQPLGQIGARGGFGVRNEAGQKPRTGRYARPGNSPHPAGQLGDPPCGLGAQRWDRLLTISSSPGISESRRSSKHTQTAALADLPALRCAS